MNSQPLMLDQNELFRKYALGSFKDLLLAVTANPAMLLWLSGADSTADDPNENYGRELMELFTLGADRPAATRRRTCASRPAPSRASRTTGLAGARRTSVSTRAATTPARR